jgi:hypothetical protein
MAAVVHRRTSALGPRAITTIAALAASAWLISCSSPPPGSGGTPRDPADRTGRPERREEPVFDFPGGAAANDAQRERVVALERFLGERGVTLDAVAVERWVALDGQGALRITIRNDGAKRLTLVGERRVGAWPFARDERARTSLRLVTSQATMRNGLQVVAGTEFDDSLGTIVVEPGDTVAIRLPFTAPLAKGALAASVAVRAELHPLALQFEGEPERVCALPFDDVVVRFGPPRVAAAADGDRVPFEAGLADDPELLVAAALRLAESDAVETVGRLIATLPGPDAAARRARIVALEWITQRRLGDSVERWRGWWDSDEGMRFGRGVAATRPADGGGR